MLPTVAHPPIRPVESSVTLAALTDDPPGMEKLTAPPARLRAKLWTLAEPKVSTAPGPLIFTLLRPDPMVSVPTVSVVAIEPLPIRLIVPPDDVIPWVSA